VCVVTPGPTRALCGGWGQVRRGVLQRAGPGRVRRVRRRRHRLRGPRLPGPLVPVRVARPAPPRPARHRPTTAPRNRGDGGGGGGGGGDNRPAGRRLPDSLAVATQPLATAGRAGAPAARASRVQVFRLRCGPAYDSGGFITRSGRAMRCCGRTEGAGGGARLGRRGGADLCTTARCTYC
jgi:hypothetical protein